MNTQTISRVGILGGTFDPIHTAHISIAQSVRKALALDSVWILPDGRPPHKTECTAPEHRLHMAQKAVEGEDGLHVCDLEVLRPGTTYTVDTLRELHALYPDTEFTYIIGSDTVDKLPTWHEFRALPPLAEIAVVLRGGDDPAPVRALTGDLSRAYGFRFHAVETEPSSVSSSDIRFRLARMLPCDGMLPAAVADYISENSLYADARLKLLRSTIPEERYIHTLGVEETAVRMAKRFGADPQKASEAALFHDCAKGIRAADELIAVCERGNVPIFESERNSRPVLHAPAGVVIARERYGITDEEILGAIRWHTTGRADMTLLEKIIYLADAIEPNRSPYPALGSIRAAAETDIDLALLYSARSTRDYVLSSGGTLSGKTQEMIQYLEEQHPER